MNRQKTRHECTEQSLGVAAAPSCALQSTTTASARGRHRGPGKGCRPTTARVIAVAAILHACSASSCTLRTTEDGSDDDDVVRESSSPREALGPHDGDVSIEPEASHDDDSGCVLRAPPKRVVVAWADHPNDDVLQQLTGNAPQTAVSLTNRGDEDLDVELILSADNGKEESSAVSAGMVTLPKGESRTIKVDLGYLGLLANTDFSGSVIVSARAYRAGDPQDVEKVTSRPLYWHSDGTQTYLYGKDVLHRDFGHGDLKGEYEFLDKGLGQEDAGRIVYAGTGQVTQQGPLDVEPPGEPDPDTGDTDQGATDSGDTGE